MALLHFKKHKPDIMILEVGLGGRLDAVNMLDADVAVITSIGLDHCDWLGNTRELVAIEKAGIFRGKQKIVCGDPCPPEILHQMARQLGAEWYCRGEHFDIQASQPASSLLADNVATAMMVVKLLPLFVTQDAVKKGVEQTRLAGRQQILQTQPLIIVDVAHNEDSVAHLADFLKQQKCKKIKAIFSALKTKDVAAMIACIQPLIDEWHIAPIDYHLAMPIATLELMLQPFSVHTYADIRSAFDSVLASAQKDDCIVAFGSFHVVSCLLT